MEPEASPLTAPPLPHLQGWIAKALLSTRHLQGHRGQVIAPTVPAHPPPHPRTFHTGFIGGDGGTLHSYTVFLGGQCRVNGDLVISLVTVWEPQVKILELDVHVGQDELETDSQGEASVQMTMTQGHVQATAGDTQPEQG